MLQSQPGDHGAFEKPRLLPLFLLFSLFLLFFLSS